MHASPILLITQSRRLPAAPAEGHGQAIIENVEHASARVGGPSPAMSSAFRSARVIPTGG
jgi:hypothetical protein